MELSLILPVLLLITVGVVDATRIFSSWVSLTNGVREGALFASANPKGTYWCADPATAPSGSVACPAGTVAENADPECGTLLGPAGNWCPDPNNVAFRIRAEGSGLDPAHITLSAPVCTTAPTLPDPNGVVVLCTDETAAQVTVTAAYEMSMIMPVIGSIFGSPLRMNASATFPIYR